MNTRSPYASRIDSESFGRNPNYYFIDLCKTVQNDPYLKITQSEASGNTYKRNNIIVFEQDLLFFMEALTMVIGRFSAGETKIS